MRRNLLIRILSGIVLVAVASSFAHADNFMYFKKKAAAAGGGSTYPDILFYWGCESTTAEYSAGDASATAHGTTPTISNAQAAVGTNSCSLPANTYYDFTLNNDDIMDTDSGKIGFYVYCTTQGGNSSLIDARYDANNRVTLRIWDADQLYIGYIAGASGPDFVATSAGTWGASAWYFVEYSWNKGGAGNDYNVLVGGTNRLANDDASGTWTKSASGALAIGDVESNGSVCFIDQVFVTNDPTRDLYAIRACTNCYP